MAKSVAYFCGAGAECSYGMPNGGKFALDLFRYDSSEDKEKFKKMRDGIDPTSRYASKWLPGGYDKKSVSSFGKSSYEMLIKGSIENKGYKVIEYLNNFDINVQNIVGKFKSQGIEIYSIMQRLLEENVGERLYSQKIKLMHAFRTENQIFGSIWFSAFITLYTKSTISSKLKRYVRMTIKSILELLISACGERLSKEFNESVFEEYIDTIDIFDDLGGIMEMDYRNAGSSILEYIVEYGSVNIDSTKPDEEQLIDFFVTITEDILSRILDYQELVDNNWRYLYNPKISWGKFCRISIFLYTAQRYIKDMAYGCAERCKTGPGYYHDILEMDKLFNRTVVGTTNYNEFIQTILENNIYFLNGSVKDMYDPYTNTIVEESNASEHMVVPFMFTQSGIKPLTAVSISRRYVELYDKFKESDFIVVIGFGFNNDDGHVNGIFRDIIEKEKKEIYILHYTEKLIDDVIVNKEYCNKLRISNTSKIHIVQVDDDRKELSTGLLWCEYLKRDFE